MQDTASLETDALCRDCAHLMPDDEEGSWCQSPQIMKYQGRGTRCIFERDGFPEPERSHGNGTGKCGKMHVNFVRREYAA